MSWIFYKDELQREARRLDKSIVLVSKNNKISKLISVFLGKEFLEKFASTLGNFIFIPERWTRSMAQNVIIHEARHVKQFRWSSFGIHPLVGIPIMAILYLFTFFPIKLALGRALLELDADKFQWKTSLERGRWSARQVLFHAKFRAKSVASSSYGWALPRFILNAMYKSAARKVINAKK